MNKILSALLSATFLISPTMALAKVGVASAVNGEPKSRPPENAERVLQIGNDMAANEVVSTKANDRAQLVFLDGSSLTIGPDSSVIIDKFVFDPERKTGELALSAGRGVMRYVGGAISKNSEVKIKTPTATIGIRGGIATVTVASNGTTTANFLFGGSLSITSQGVTQTTTQPGMQIVAPAGRPPTTPTPAPPAAVQEITRSLQASAGSSVPLASSISQAFGGSTFVQVNSSISPAAARAAIPTTQGTQLAVAKTPSTQGTAVQGAGPLQTAGPLAGSGPLQASGPMQGTGPLQNAGPLAAGTPLQQNGPIAGPTGLSLAAVPPTTAIPNAPTPVAVAAIAGDTGAVQQLQNVLSTPQGTTPAALTSMVSSVSSSSSASTSSPATTTTTTTFFTPTPLAPTVYNSTTSASLSPN